MVISAILGVISGLTAAAFFWGLRFLVSLSEVSAWLSNRWFLVPLALGAVVAYFVREKPKKNWDPTDSVADLFEEFHYGIQRAAPIVWVVRAFVTFTLALFTGILGLEGAIIEAVTALVQTIAKRLPKSMKRIALHDIETRQIIVDATIAGALSVSLGAPFAAALLSLEMLSVSGSRARVAAFTSALTAYGAWRLAADSLSIEPMGIVSVLFLGFRPLEADALSVFKLMVAAMVLGGFFGVFYTLLGRLVILAKGAIARERVLSPMRATAAGAALLALTVFLTPEAFIEPWRIWQEMAWGHMSNADAVTGFFARSIALVFAVSVFGSWGILTPVLSVAALLGYAFGNFFGAAWALPLALAACAAAVNVTFAAPLAALALIWEACGDGTLWAIAAAAVAGSFMSRSLLQRYIAPMNTLFASLLERRGIRMVGGRCADVLKNVTMSNAMITDFVVIEENASLLDVQRKATESQYSVLGVCSEKGEFVGLLTLDKLPSSGDLKGVSPQDLLDSDAIEVAPHAPLEESFALLVSAPALAVVTEDRKLVGLVFRGPVITRYHREIGRRALSFYTSRTSGK